MLLSKKIIDSLNKEIKAQKLVINTLKENEISYGVNHQTTIAEIQKSVDFMLNVLSKAQ